MWDYRALPSVWELLVERLCRSLCRHARLSDTIRRETLQQVNRNMRPPSGALRFGSIRSRPCLKPFNDLLLGVVFPVDAKSVNGAERSPLVQPFENIQPVNASIQA